MNRDQIKQALSNYLDEISDAEGCGPTPEDVETCRAKVALEMHRLTAEVLAAYQG